MTAPLRDFFEEKFIADERLIAVGFAAMGLTLFLLERTRALLRAADQEAIHVLADTFDTRMKGTNEWRATLEDQNKDKATIATVEAVKAQVEDLKTEQRAAQNRSMGAGKLAGIIGGLVAGAGTLAMIAFAFARSQGAG